MVEEEKRNKYFIRHESAVVILRGEYTYVDREIVDAVVKLESMGVYTVEGCQGGKTKAKYGVDAGVYLILETGCDYPIDLRDVLVKCGFSVTTSKEEYALNKKHWVMSKQSWQKYNHNGMYSNYQRLRDNRHILDVLSGGQITGEGTEETNENCGKQFQTIMQDWAHDKLDTTAEKYMIWKWVPNKWFLERKNKVEAIRCQ